jgi:predicted ABC-type transport system involved in lysophospholipase L1 biosynthesis ATPase subunit
MLRRRMVMGELVLVLDGVGKGFRRGRRRWQVLVDVSLTVAAGEMVGVVGARGEGKTTLLEVAAGIELADEGSVCFQGRDLAGCSADERSGLLGDRIAWMPREGAGDFEVLDFVGLPLAMGRGRGMREADDLAMAALERVGAVDAARKRWCELSDWERVLVAFARGFVGRPSLMVVDDLLDGLGPRGTREAGELLLALAGELGCGVLVAASDLDALLVAHRVLCFERGTLAVMSGQTHDETNIVDLRDSRRRVSSSER